MRAEIIAIGDELTSGQRLDTNSQWLATELGKLGVAVAFHTTIGDRLEDNLQAFRLATQRVDIVISTGGLGPTADDLTRDAIAGAFGVALEYRDEAMQHILNLFAHRKRPMPERNRVQAMFPVGSRLIDNRFGTAPGIDFTTGGNEHKSCRIFALPGVPAEMHEMYSEVVRPRLIQEMGLGSQQWFYKNLRLFGLGESDVEALIPDLIARQRQPIVGITVSKATINLRIATLAGSAKEADQKMQPTIDEIEQHLSTYIFGTEHDEPWDAVVRALAARGETLRVMEYGSTSVLGAFLTSAASALGCDAMHATGQSLEPQSLITSTRWEKTKPSNEVFGASTEWTLQLGPYPKLSQAGNFSGNFEIEIWRGNALLHQKSQPISGHPELVWHRLAKAGAKELLDFWKLSASRT